MKKLINAPDDVVGEALRGLASAHSDLVRVDLESSLVIRRDAPIAGKVGIVSGGGSGHEPLHGGFVGPGMLDVACAGAIFTSPVPDQVLAATRAVDGGAGVLHIVKNYSGDVMNFEMAAELAQAENIRIETVITNDDVAVKDSLYTTGRRGVGVTVLVEKIAGARAEEGASLAEVAAVARKVNARGRSMGMALTSCTVPAAGRPTFELAEDEMEVGIGIHGEPGRGREALKSAREITELLANSILEDLPFHAGDQVLALVNGMGGTPLIELYLMFGLLRDLLKERDIQITRSLVGNYITSLDMAGCSFTLLKLDAELVRLWDAPVRTAGLLWEQGATR
jgi:dihydroxyacetone kinase-like protein